MLVVGKGGKEVIWLPQIANFTVRDVFILPCFAIKSQEIENRGIRE
jgi:hypothetical protein